MIIFKYQNSILLTVELDSRCHCSRWYPTTYSSAYTLSTSWTTILREQYSLSQLGHVDCYLSSLSCSLLWLWKVHFLKGQLSKVWHILSPRTDSTTFPSTTHWNSLQLLDWKWLSLKRISQQYNTAFAMTSVGVKIDNSVTRQSGSYCFKIQSFIISLVLFFLMVIKL